MYVYACLPKEFLAFMFAYYSTMWAHFDAIQPVVYGELLTNTTYSVWHNSSLLFPQTLRVSIKPILIRCLLHTQIKTQDKCSEISQIMWNRNFNRLVTLDVVLFSTNCVVYNLKIVL